MPKSKANKISISQILQNTGALATIIGVIVSSVIASGVVSYLSASHHTLTTTEYSTTTTTSLVTSTTYSTSTVIIPSTTTSFFTVYSTTTTISTAQSCPVQIPLEFEIVPSSAYQAGIFVGYVGNCNTITVQVNQTSDTSICVDNCAGVSVQYSGVAQCTPTVVTGEHWWINNYNPCTDFSTLPNQYCSPTCVNPYNKTSYSIIVSSFPANYIGITGNNEDSIQAFGHS